VRQFLKGVNNVDANGNPSGGYVKGVGLNIKWQEGPLGNPPNLANHNGAFVEGAIEAAKQRLEFFQKSKFAHPSNQAAIDYLAAALDALDTRTEERKARKVEGTHAV